MLELQGHYLSNWVYGLRDLHPEPGVVEHAHKVPGGLIGLMVRKEDKD